MEHIENRRRKQIQTEILNEEKTRLESRINEKHERVERRQKEISAQKVKKKLSLYYLLTWKRKKKKFFYLEKKWFTQVNVERIFL